MRTNRFLMIAALGAALCLTSCSNEVEEIALPADSGSRQMSLTLTLPGGDASTRMAYEMDTETGNLKVTWAKGDKITVYTDKLDSATFTLVGNGGSAKGTFTGEIPDSWGLKDNDELWINYPELKKITVNGVERTCFVDGRKQSGKIEDFMDVLSGKLVYTSDALSLKGELAHMASYLHLPKDLALFIDDSDVSGDATITLSNIISGQCAGSARYLTDDIVVKTSLGGSSLQEDLYIGFMSSTGAIPTLTVECSSKEITYNLDRIGGFKTGQMYTINNIASLTKPDPLTIQAVSAGTITIKNPMGLVISYVVDGQDMVTTEENNTEDIVINVAAGKRARFFGDNPTYCDGTNFTNILCSSECYIYGNIMSLIDSKNYDTLKELTGTYTFSYLFDKNINIKTHKDKALVLPATTLTAACYSGMFHGCKSLTSVPEDLLPATNLATLCYWGMFAECSYLTNAPSLPAEDLKEGCYKLMFAGCSLETAPQLPAKTLVKDCYFQMFYYCNALNSVTCLATSISASDCTYEWLSYVAKEGTFTSANKDVEWTTGVNGIPEGWNVNYAE